MTAHEFLQSKEPNVFTVPEEWLEEYANIVLNIAAEKAELTDDSDIYSRINKSSILNCLKD